MFAVYFQLVGCFSRSWLLLLFSALVGNRFYSFHFVQFLAKIWNLITFPRTQCYGYISMWIQIKSSPSFNYNNINESVMQKYAPESHLLLNLNFIFNSSSSSSYFFLSGRCFNLLIFIIVLHIHVWIYLINYSNDLLIFFCLLPFAFEAGFIVFVRRQQIM